MADDQSRIIDQVMQGYGRMRPADRNTVTKYIQENPDYAATVARRLGIKVPNGGGGGDDRYENAQDSMAMRTLMKSMDEGPSKADVAKPSPTAASGKSKMVKADPSIEPGARQPTRTGMQSERAAEEIDRRGSASVDESENKRFAARQPKNVATPNGAAASADGDNGLGTAAAGLGIGGTIGYLLNKYLGSQKPQGMDAPAFAGRGVATAAAPARSTAMQVLDDSVIDVPFREVPPQGQIEAAPRQLEGPIVQENAAQPARQLAAPPQGVEDVDRSVVESINSKPPGGPVSSTDGAARNIDVDTKTPNMIDRMNRRVRTPKVGRY